MLKLKYFGHLLRRANSLEKTLTLAKLKAGGEGTTEDEMIGRHRRPNGREFEKAPGGGEGQGHVESCSPRGGKESDTTEQLSRDTDLGCGRISAVLIHISLTSITLGVASPANRIGACVSAREQQCMCQCLRTVYLGCSLRGGSNAIFLQPHGLPADSRADVRLFGASERSTGALLGDAVSAEERAWGPILDPRGGWPHGLGRFRPVARR